MNSDWAAPSATSLIKTDRQLVDAALRLFEEFEEFEPNPPVRISQPELPLQQRDVSPSIRPFDQEERQYEEEYLQHEHLYGEGENDDVDTRNNNNIYKPSLEELERRKAQKWLYVIEQHNRDNTFSPAICKRSLDLLQRKKHTARSGRENQFGGPPSSSSLVMSSRGVSTALPSRHRTPRENSSCVTRLFNPHVIPSVDTHIDHQQNPDEHNNYHQPQQLGSEDFVERLYYADTQRRKEMDAERELLAEANRLLRQRELILQDNPSTHRAATPPLPATRISNHNNENGIITSPNPKSPNCGEGSEPFRRQQSSSVGISASERLYAISQRRLEPPAAARTSTAANNKKPATDPALFERLHSDASRIKEVRDAKIAEASRIPMRQLDTYELGALVERVHTGAIEARSENLKILTKANTPSFHPAIESSSAKMVGARNSAAGDVFHRLAQKPPSGEH